MKQVISPGKGNEGRIGEAARGIATSVSDRLARGLTPTADWYTSDDLHRLELDRIFSRTWQLVGGVHEVAEPGQFKVVTVAGQREFIVVRDHDGHLRALANVCPHRGMMLAEGQGSCGTLRCGYHGWTFDLDGTLRGGPALRELPSFEASEYSLAPVSIDTWGAFLFVNPDPAADPLADFLRPLQETLEGYGIDYNAVGLTGTTKSISLDFECNWKIGVENALECYHCATVHPGFRATVDLPAWHIQMARNLIVQGTKIRRDGERIGAAQSEAPAGHLAASVIDTSAGMDDAMFHMLFPNNSISLWPGPANSFNFARWVPMGPHRTRWLSTRWWPAGTDQDIIEDQWAFMASVGAEDTSVIEGVHRGMCSGSFIGGRYILRGESTNLDDCAVTRDERGPLRLNRLIAAQLLSENVND
jgi:choline monooxygenase